MAILPKQKYSQDRVDKLQEYLRIYHEKGTPLDYEIVVDGLKVVRRTADPSMFSMFEGFVNGDTKSVEIIIYNGTSNTYDKHIFSLDDSPTTLQGIEQPLSGLEIEARIKEHVLKARQDWEFELLRKENADLKDLVDELEEEIAKLEKAKEKEEESAKNSQLKGLLGEVGSSFVESFVRRNPKVVSALPGGEALAGILAEDNKRTLEAHEPVGEVSFAPMTGDMEMSAEDRAAIDFVGQLKSKFDKHEFDKVMYILDALAADKEKIEEVINELNNSDEQVPI